MEYSSPASRFDPTADSGRLWRRHHLSRLARAGRVAAQRGDGQLARLRVR